MISTSSPASIATCCVLSAMEFQGPVRLLVQPHLLLKCILGGWQVLLVTPKRLGGKGRDCGAIPRKRGRSAKNWVMVATRFQLPKSPGTTNIGAGAL